ncbi:MULTISPECIES: hypothetical protein [Alphaproteobacteria]|uniref:Uncharacterized protein n=2 Tax=Alphaproteobacteria TaxID=28211 RepID=A0A512HPV2_9HYPH|nr:MULTISPECIES: hypothetical protein [Alphaproteobacteria]GEO87471.1 hypothetical protein RNA01_44030 [Ciceribacter naphthalenivorans]GLR23709.1 hypothetical protein GCM10007920_35010 [Ciceribacter naphthalenivorans]GLT06565.1 hypothetical protein GCM10007926_35010 [Sphingomonas psychrolutea]
MRVFVLVLAFLGATAMPLSAAGTYDLLFAKTALSGLAASAPPTDGQKGSDTLVYDRVVSPLKKGQSPDTDTIGLQLTSDDKVALILHRGPQMRFIGSFPASVGNPLIMYFLESALSDVAKQSGGSPFYMRNRIKEALLKDAEIVPVSVRIGERDVAARQVTIRPFAKDKARDQMGRFAELALAVTVSEDVPGWYYSLRATVPEGSGPEDISYSSAITLTDGGEAKP